jgi:hypothetical protein
MTSKSSDAAPEQLAPEQQVRRRRGAAEHASGRRGMHGDSASR